MADKSTGFKLLKKTCDFNFLKWGEYMKRAQLAERKVEKLKRLILLTDPAVEKYQMNRMTIDQYNEFLRIFPEENPTIPAHPEFLKIED